MSEDSTLPASANSSVSEEPISPTAVKDSLFDVEANHSQEVESLKRILEEVSLNNSIPFNINFVVIFIITQKTFLKN